jgi:hypothetical protein
MGAKPVMLRLHLSISTIEILQFSKKFGNLVPSASRWARQSSQNIAGVRRKCDTPPTIRLTHRLHHPKVYPVSFRIENQPQGDPYEKNGNMGSSGGINDLKSRLRRR